MSDLVVCALGGNALARRGERLDASVQQANVRLAADALGRVAQRHRMVVTHGNGPQVGLLALQSEAYPDVAPYPLDILGAETEGMIGYLIEQELGRRLSPVAVATLLTQVVVDPSDPGFAHPTKPVGPVYGVAEGELLALKRGWVVAPDGDGVRRVVPSPQPVEILELVAIRVLLDAGVVVVCAGGGGIPVVPDGMGGFRGVEAVIDKDLAAALLAIRLEADVLVLLTDVDGVYEGFGAGAASARRIDQAGVADLRGLGLPAGSMGPKVEAACRFVEAGGRAAIGALEDAAALVEGLAGTQVVA